MRSFIFLVFFTAIKSISSECKLGIFEAGVRTIDTNIIVDKHNELRLLLAKGKVPNQPRAINMKRLKYDIKLGKAAQNLSNTCVFQHAPYKDTRWFWVGQNLFLSMSTSNASGPDWNSTIQTWFNEHQNYKYPNNPDSKTGHYTQVAWATTEYVGCGYTFFKSDGNFVYRKLYVCNYGPGGNIVNQAPYKTGEKGCISLC